MRKRSTSSVLRYACAPLSVAVATWVRLLLDPALGDRLPFITLFVAVTFTAWYGGVGPSLVCVALGASAAAYFVLEPRGTFAVWQVEYQAGLVLFAFVGLVSLLLTEAMRAAQRRADAEVTERKAALRQKEESLALLDTLQNNAPVGFAFVDRDCRYVRINEALAALSGRPAADHLGLTVQESVPELWPQLEPLYRGVLRTGRPVTNREVTGETPAAPGQVRHWLVSSYPVRVREETAGLGILVTDITERTRLEDEVRRRAEQLQEADRRKDELLATLRQSEARLRAVFDGSVDGIVIADDEGRYVEANPRAGELFGVGREQLLGRRISDFAEPGFPFDRAWQDFQNNGHSRGEFRLVRPDGTSRDLDFAATADVLPGRHLSVLRDVTERKQTERALREAEARFAAVVNHSPSCIFAKDRQGRYLLANRALAQMVGREPEECLGKTDADFFPPDVAARFGGDDGEILNEGRPRVYEESFPHGGTTVTALTVKFPLRDADGNAYGVCGIATDVSAQKRAGEALAVSEERLRLALEAGRMGVWDWSLLTNEINWSDNLEPMHGLAPGSFGGTLEAFQQLIHPDDREAVAEAIRGAVERRSGYDVEFRNVWPDGSVHWMSGKGKVFTGEGGQPVRMIGVGTDVTQRKRSEQTARFLADASATLAALVDFDSTLQKVASLAVPYFADWATVDLAESDGSVRRVAVAHVDPAKVELAHAVHRRFPPDPASAQGLWHILRTGQSEIVPKITDELLVRSVKDEELLGILRELGLKSYIGVPLRVRGKALGVIAFIAAESSHVYDDNDLAVAQDLAGRAGIAIENAQLYRELREADRRKDEFLAMLAHELRNPLAPIQNALHLVRLRGDDQREGVRQTWEVVERQVEHLIRLVDDLLDVSRITRGKVKLQKQAVDVATVVARAVEGSRPLIDSRGHRLEVAVPDEPLWVEGDPTRLAQVLWNLLNNSAKYSPEGSRIWLTVERGPGEAAVRVRDTGLGIPAEVLPRIFDLFTQAERTLDRAEGGLGIGLTLVRQLTEMHGGTVEAFSDGPGRGSEFVVRLPLLPGGPPALEAGNAPREASQACSRRILVVDDNRDSANSLSMLLRLIGNEVRTAHDGREALAAVAAYRPDLVLLDIGLPLVDGYEVARRIRSDPGFGRMVLVALTGYGGEEDRRRAQVAGFDHHMVKPVDFDALQGLLASMESPGKPDALPAGEKTVS